MRPHLIQTPLRQRLLSRLPPQGNAKHQFRANSSSQPKTPAGGASAKPSGTAGGTSPSISHAPGAESSARGAAAPASIWMRLGPITTIATAFARAQKRRPYVVQIASAFVIFSCADVSAQSISGAEYDAVRTARTMLIGSVFAIPQYRWFHILARYFNYKSKVLSVTAKVIFNQFTFAVFFPTYFFAMQALLSGESITGTVQRLQDTVPRSWQNSWKVWPAAMAFNLSVVPLEYRALFSGLIAIGWQTYLSWMNRQAELKEHDDHEAAQGTEVQISPIQQAAIAA